MNTINIAENLKNSAGLTNSRMIGISAINLINAGIMANDSKEAACEAKRIYGKLSRGMWKKVQSDSRRLIATASVYGLTIEKPYIIKDGIVYGALAGGIVPMFGSEQRNFKE